MRRNHGLRARPIAAALLACCAACTGASGTVTPGFDPAAGLARCRAARVELDAAWQRLEAARAAVEPAPGQPGPATAPGSPEQEVAVAQSAFDLAYGEDQAALAEFLSGALRLGTVPAETAAALELFAASAIRTAGDAIERSGDYRRAVDLLETARGYFAEARSAPPANLLAALERARSYSVLTRSRFDRLTTGMSPAQVRALVGVPAAANIHRSEVAGKQVTSWLYRSEDGGVSGLYFDDTARLYAWRWDVRRTG